MHFRWTEDRAGLACERIRARTTYEEIASDMGTTKSAITGLVMRLRNAGDARLPTIARRPRGVTAKAQGQIGVLAELMAEGCASISAAAVEMSISQSRADQLWQRIRSDLGEQAR